MSTQGGTSAPFLLMAVASAVLMGTIGVISKYVGLSAETLTFYRLGFGAALMLGYLLLVGQARLLLIWPSWRVLANGALLAAFIVCYVQAMLYTSMANAIMMVYLSPVAASVVAHFLLGERLSSAGVGLILLALFGFAMMMEFQLSFDSAGDATGMAYAALAMLAYAGFILMNRIMPARVHAYTRCWYQLLAGALCMLPLMWQQGESIASAQWGWLLLAGLLPGFLAILFAVIALRELPAATFGTLAYMEPIAVVTFGWVLFGEALNTLQLSGCALIMGAGVAQALLNQRRERTARALLAQNARCRQKATAESA
ncbi:threonine/homoserine efflux transporter RhtA [Marinobacterium halophilum]|uniref:Threonine/homoserine efflux transporter RhtA n=1 Tax=Marinobacterium halophilum TaxID=267374 RepID=A0A2P8EWL0_9GAMM|nr:DMT family transporter [Marinobacterium halophilum]PSL13864.1 threonine/homoserine efflux transporter RhtA [Marinobacterium halophilum]